MAEINERYCTGYARLQFSARGKESRSRGGLRHAPCCTKTGLSRQAQKNESDP